MRLQALRTGLAVIALTSLAHAQQRIQIGIAPAYDGGGDEFGEAVVQHLTLYTYQNLLGNKQFIPSLLTPGGVYTPLDSCWLTVYVQDRPELDLLLVSTLKPTVSVDKGNSYTISVEVALLDAHTGDTKSTWTVSDVIKSKNAWYEKGQSMITSAINERSDRYGLNGISPSSDFSKQPIGKTTAHLADEVRDTLGAHLAGFAKASPEVVDASGSVSGSGPCEMHTKVTYNYRHSVSHSYTLLADGLDETTTIQDGISDFKAPEGPLLLQFTINDAPYKLSKQAIYQMSTVHSCKSSTLVIDIGQGGDAHQHWE
jgi:hypothetical protein